MTEEQLREQIAAMVTQNAAYPYIGVVVPPVLKLMTERTATAIAATAPSMAQVLTDARMARLSNLYRRLGDADLYVDMIARERQAADPHRAATLVGSLLVGYLSAAKSVLDAVAITINDALVLQLPSREQDFGKGKFWNELGKAAPTRYLVYEPFREFGRELIKWRDAAVHRSTPLVLVSGSLERVVRREEVKIQLAWHPGADVAYVLKQTAPSRVRWASPMDLCEAWREQFLNLYDAVADDVAR